MISWPLTCVRLFSLRAPLDVVLDSLSNMYVASLEFWVMSLRTILLLVFVNEPFHHGAFPATMRAGSGMPNPRFTLLGY